MSIQYIDIKVTQDTYMEYFFSRCLDPNFINCIHRQYSTDKKNMIMICKDPVEYLNFLSK